MGTSADPQGLGFEPVPDVSWMAPARCQVCGEWEDYCACSDDQLFADAYLSEADGFAEAA